MVIKINKHILVMFMGQFGVFRSAIQTQQWKFEIL
jgi:hypothetical protein